MIGVIDYYNTQFGELWQKSLFDLVEEVIEKILKQKGIDKGEIDAIFFGNMLSGVLENNLHTASKIAEIVKLNIPIFRTEAACASGGVAFNLACQYLNSNENKTVLVIGAEKMSDFSPEQVVTGLAAAASGEEQEAGLTFPGLYALMANYYLEKYKYNEKNLAYVPYKNHYHGSLNDKAQFRKKISIEAVLKSPYVAYPLKVLDSSPITDGAAGLLLTNKKNYKNNKGVYVLSSEIATDTISLKARKNLDELAATKIASKKAFKAAQLAPKDINVAELHDCFSIAEILAMEDLGFWKKGTGGGKIKELGTMFGSGEKLIVNTSGGLKAAGHPVGATGIKQIGELFLQLTGQARNRQVKNVKYGLAQNVGGSGGSAVVTILGI